MAEDRANGFLNNTWFSSSSLIVRVASDGAWGAPPGVSTEIPEKARVGLDTATYFSKAKSSPRVSPLDSLLPSQIWTNNNFSLFYNYFLITGQPPVSQVRNAVDVQFPMETHPTTYNSVGLDALYTHPVYLTLVHVNPYAWGLLDIPIQVNPFETAVFLIGSIRIGFTMTLQ